jgi:hypothetical protein
VAPFIAGTFTGNDGGVGSLDGRFGGWRGRRVEDKVANACEDLGSEKIPFSSSLFLLGSEKLVLGSGKFPPCISELQHGSLVACHFCCHPDVVKGSNSVVNKEALFDPSIKHPKMHVMDIWVLLGADRIRMGAMVQDIPIDGAIGSMAALDSGNPVLEDIANVMALLLLAKFIGVSNGVVVRVCGVIGFPPLHQVVRVHIFFITVVVIFCHADKELGP